MVSSTDMIIEQTFPITNANAVGDNKETAQIADSGKSVNSMAMKMRDKMMVRNPPTAPAVFALLKNGVSMYAIIC